MKLENITIVFHSIMHYNPFDRLSYVTQQYRQDFRHYKEERYDATFFDFTITALR